MKKILLFIPIALILAGLSGCVRENDMAESIIFVHTWNTDHNEIRTYTKDGEFITAWPVSACPDRCNILCADINNNVYLIDTSTDKIYKYKSDGTLLVTKDVDAAFAITAGPDGYIYELGIDILNSRIIKRDPDTLDIVATMSGIELPAAYGGFTCDQDGYLFLYRTATDEVEKWDFDSATKVASRTPPVVATALCVAGNLLGGFNRGGVPDQAFTMSKDLDEDGTAWSLGDITSYYDAAGIYGDFLFGGYNSGDSKEKVLRYTTARVKVWEIDVGGIDFNVTGVAAYPFLEEEEEAQPIISLIG